MIDLSIAIYRLHKTSHRWTLLVAWCLFVSRSFSAQRRSRAISASAVSATTRGLRLSRPSLNNYLTSLLRFASSFPQSSTTLFFALILSIVKEGWIYSCYPPMLVSLPTFWIPGFIGGAVTSRLVPIYIAICNTTPLLVECGFDSSDDFVLSKASSRRLLMKRGGGGGGGDHQNTTTTNSEDKDANQRSITHPNYSSEHHTLFHFCKDYEELFGLRVFRFKVTLHVMIQLFALYFSVVTLVLN
jgi:hypothetical protein